MKQRQEKIVIKVKVRRIRLMKMRTLQKMQKMGQTNLIRSRWAEMEIHEWAGMAGKFYWVTFPIEWHQLIDRGGKILNLFHRKLKLSKFQTWVSSL